jgi:uncharacterized delta-60 repeat protein
MTVLYNLNVNFSFSKKTILVIFCSLFLSAQISAAPGRLDYSFQNNLASGSDIRSIEIQADEKILVAGSIAPRGAMLRQNIIRLNADGSFDSTFNIIETFRSGETISFIKLQTNEKIIVITNFGELYRLNTNGSRDPTFSLSGFNVAAVRDLDVQTDGKILVSGFNLAGTDFITRFNADGSHDAGFNTAYGSGSVTFAPLENKIYIYKRVSSGVSQMNRLNINGSIDATFAAATVTSTQFEPLVNAEPLPNGKILIWGKFITVNGANRNNLAVLNSDGNLDASFIPATRGTENILSVAVQSNGKIIIGGSNFSSNTFVRGNVARLNADGSADSTFNQGRGANADVRALKIRNNNKLLVGGSFFRYHIFPRSGLAQVNL